MITNLHFSKAINSDLEDFVGTRNNLFITKDNKRKNIKSLADLKDLYKESCFAIRKEDKGSTQGILFVWKYNALNGIRNYVKVEYNSITDVDDLLMVLNWNFNKEVYVKLDRKSPLIDSFRKKGFKVCHDRGDELLLCRSKNDKRFIPPYKGDEEED